MILAKNIFKGTKDSTQWPWGFTMGSVFVPPPSFFIFRKVPPCLATMACVSSPSAASSYSEAKPWPCLLANFTKEDLRGVHAQKESTFGSLAKGGKRSGGEAKKWQKVSQQEGEGKVGPAHQAPRCVCTNWNLKQAQKEKGASSAVKFLQQAVFLFEN